ncbi:MAG: alpha/beta hydrolase [Microthrixaceae bacterium]
MAISLLAAAAAATACSDDQPVAAPSTSAPPVQSVPCGSAETVQYSQHDGVSPELNSLDVHTPPPDANGECTGRPLVIWIHGGGWTEGDKASGIDDKVRLFTGAGYVFASVNYRLTDPNIVPAAPRHPVHDQDAADAVAWLLSHADEPASTSLPTTQRALSGNYRFTDRLPFHSISLGKIKSIRK